MTELHAGTAASVYKVLVAQGERVEVGDTLILLESMKMEIPIDSPIAGTVDQLHAEEGAAVSDGDLLAVII